MEVGVSLIRPRFSSFSGFARGVHSGQDPGLRFCEPAPARLQDPRCQTLENRDPYRVAIRKTERGGTRIKKEKHFLTWLAREASWPLPYNLSSAFQVLHDNLVEICHFWKLSFKSVENEISSFHSLVYRKWCWSNQSAVFATGRFLWDSELESHLKASSKERLWALLH